MPPTPAKRRRLAGSPMQCSSGKKTATASLPSANSPTKTLSNRDWKKRKQQQSYDYNTHQFLDASATVHAGLFGARRLPEIKSLWRQMVQGEINMQNGTSDRRSNIDQKIIRQVGESGGGKISSRHLRRRTNSHKRKRRHRFPRGKDEFGVDGSGLREDSECGNSVMRDKEKTDMEVNSDHSVKQSSEELSKQKRNLCRRARRKPTLLKMSHSNWWQHQTKNEQINESSVSNQANKTKAPHNWIPSHLWHAKRFHVSPPLFSWSMPLLHSNRGSRASLRLASSESSPKCTIQDATWEVDGCAITLKVKKVTPSQSERQPMQSLIPILQRLCGSDAPFLNEESILSGRRSGEGLVHEIDAHPLQPIGPATFIFGNGDVFDSVHLSMLVHPAIHQRVLSLLMTILSTEFDTNAEIKLSTAPLALLRIRGRASTSTVLKILQQAEDICLLGGDDVNHGTLIELGTPHSLTVAPRNDTKSVPNTIFNPSLMLLKSHLPNQSYRHLPHNLACSGWDILCHPSIGSSLFQTFVSNGGACAIGLLEDARAHLEAYPPLPVFPRDYPDTEEGKAYWEGGISEVLVKKKRGEDVKQLMATWKDWAVIRTCLEGCRGRLNTSLKGTVRHWKQHGHDDLAKKKAEKEDEFTSQKELPGYKLITKGELLGRDSFSIHWESLMSEDTESTIVVRGSFGIPFLQLLHGCGKLFHSLSGSNTSEKSRRRRPRRKVRPPSSNVHASPLSKKDSEAHSSLCQQLRTSLSLPALLRCELYSEGKGTLEAGDLILPVALQDADDISEDSDVEDGSGHAVEKSHALPLGVVVAGGFSPSRGKCHGIGFVGAAKFIGTLDSTKHGMGVPIPQSNGQKLMMLKVMIVGKSSWAGCRRYALLSLLF